jgi:excisionase family DNA binding protein
MTSDEWITTKEAAELSGYNVQYVRRLIRNGRIDARKFGPLWQVSRQSLLSYLTTAKQSADKRRGPSD